MFSTDFGSQGFLWELLFLFNFFSQEACDFFISESCLDLELGIAPLKLLALPPNSASLVRKKLYSVFKACLSSSMGVGDRDHNHLLELYDAEKATRFP